MQKSPKNGQILRKWVFEANLKKKINTAQHLLAFIYFLCHIMYMFEVFEL